jgi:hypothetical protein
MHLFRRVIGKKGASHIGRRRHRPGQARAVGGGQFPQEHKNKLIPMGKVCLLVVLPGAG